MTGRDLRGTLQHRVIAVAGALATRAPAMDRPCPACWLNQVETWFSIVHRKAIRRGVFRSVAHLKDAIQRFLDAWNERKHPFVWVKTADQVLRRYNQKPISGPVH